MPLLADNPAWHTEFLAGVGYTHHETNAAAFVDFVGPARPLVRGFLLSPMFSVGAVGPTSSLGPEYDKTVWVAAGGARIWFGRGFFGSFQVAATGPITPSLSSHYQFVSSGGWGNGHFVLTLRHISNASFSGTNYGETMLMAGVAF